MKLILSGLSKEDVDDFVETFQYYARRDPLGVLAHVKMTVEDEKEASS